VSSKRQLIVDAVKARLATIKTTGGYQTNIGNNVKEWLLTSLEESELPAVTLADGVEKTIIPAEGKNSGLYTRQLPFAANLVLAESDATATLARKAIADVITCIGKDDTWGGLARRTLPDTDDLTVDSEGQRIGGARITFIVEYGRKHWEP
jgi:hypothetical protein